MGCIKIAGASLAQRYEAAVRFAQVQTEIKNRMRRRDCLRAELIADPAWDILLEAYAFALVNRTVTMSGLTERIDFPTTTAARWVRVLEAEGLLDRAVDPAEQAEVNFALTAKALEALDSYFSGAM